eukprot:5190735-Pyramimonas_sp.AAC.1
MVAGDWNCTPQQFSKSGWSDLVGGEVTTAHNTEYICSAGADRMIDYVVIDRRAQHLFPEECITADFGAIGGADRAHYGLQILVNFSVSRAQGWVLQRPRAFDHPARAKRAADPDSK